MKVKDLINILSKYNLDAEVSVIAHNREYNYSMTFGGGDGVEKHNAKSVHFYVDALCNNERSNKMVCGLKRGTCDCSQQDIDCQYLVPDDGLSFVCEDPNCKHCAYDEKQINSDEDEKQDS